MYEYETVHLNTTRYIRPRQSQLWPWIFYAVILALNSEEKKIEEKFCPRFLRWEVVLRRWPIVCEFFPDFTKWYKYWVLGLIISVSELQSRHKNWRGRGLELCCVEADSPVYTSNLLYKSIDEGLFDHRLSRYPKKGGRKNSRSVLHRLVKPLEIFWFSHEQN